MDAFISFIVCNYCILAPTFFQQDFIIHPTYIQLIISTSNYVLNSGFNFFLKLIAVKFF